MSYLRVYPLVARELRYTFWNINFSSEKNKRTLREARLELRFASCIGVFAFYSNTPKSLVVGRCISCDPPTQNPSSNQQAVRLSSKLPFKPFSVSFPPSLPDPEKNSGKKRKTMCNKLTINQPAVSRGKGQSAPWPTRPKQLLNSLLLRLKSTYVTGIRCTKKQS